MALHSTIISRAGFSHAFATRGESDADIASAVGAASVIQVKQVHGAGVAMAGAAAGTEADAIIARGASGQPSAGLGAAAIGVRVADCVPLLLADPRSGDVSAVHAGWRGVEAGVVRAAMEALGREGSSVVAAIGPCIGACCFEVGRDVAARLVKACGDAGVVVWESRDKAYVDLRAAVRAQLHALGVVRAHIDDVSGCTKHEGERFHSYRRDGAGSGRMLAAIAARR
jgi:YfiH family protein